VQQRTERIRVLNLVSFSPSGKPTSTKVLNLLIFSYNPRKEWAVFLTYSCGVSWLAVEVSQVVVARHVCGPEVSSHNLRLFELHPTPPSFPAPTEELPAR
jgi:hypothetical protein